MSAINVLKQRDCVHLCVDSAGYDAEGYIEQFIQKSVALPHLKCVVASRGDPRGNFLVGMCLAGLFESFDHLVECVEDAMPQILNELPPNDLNPRNEFVFCGWSDEQKCAQAFFLQTALNEFEPDDGEPVAGSLLNAAPNKLVALNEATFTPAISTEAMLAAKPKGRIVRDMNDLDPVVDLLRVTELQRAQRIARAPNGPQRHWVGGFATLTTVTEHTVTSRVIGRWPQDRIGDLIEPQEIDWDVWNREHAIPDRAPVELSRLREQMLQRKARKLARS
jgi:hypothetical protein